jgi:hypothetical protein
VVTAAASSIDRKQVRFISFSSSQLIAQRATANHETSAVVQLLYSRHARHRQVRELTRMVTSYVTGGTIPGNNAFTGSSADFDREKYREMANLGTATEIFLLLHEYGHLHLDRRGIRRRRAAGGRMGSAPAAHIQQHQFASNRPIHLAGTEPSRR